MNEKSSCMRYPLGGLKAGGAAKPPPAITLAPKFLGAASRFWPALHDCVLICTHVYYTTILRNTLRQLYTTLPYEACSQPGHRSTGDGAPGPQDPQR